MPLFNLSPTPINPQTTNYTLVAQDSTVTVNPSNSTVTATLPSAVGLNGKIYTIYNIGTGTGQVNIATTSSQTVGGRSMAAGAKIVLAYTNTSVQVISDGANWQILSSGEVICAKGTGSTQSIDTNGSVYAPGAETYDSHGVFGSGTFTCPAAGLYQIDMCASTAASSAAVYDDTTKIQQNGSTIAEQNNYNNGSVTQQYNNCISTTVRCAVGDTLNGFLRFGYTRSLDGDATRNYINISKIAD